ncbi:MAG: hypothetical protein V4633_17715 [Pseudomonadota bacterium]
MGGKALHTAKAPRDWLSLEYHDPVHILRGLREIAIDIGRTSTPEAIRNLRTNSLKPYREGRQAALFCYGLSQRLGTRVRFALQGRQDHETDAIGFYAIDGKAFFLPIQIKELPPAGINPLIALQDVLSKVGTHYAGTTDMIVAIHVNRDVRIVISELKIPENIAELWLFGATDESQNTWFLIGDLISQPGLSTEFSHPGRTLLIRVQWPHTIPNSGYA